MDQNLTWDLKDDVLTISGTGEMTSNPWWALMDKSSFCQTKVVIEEGVTSILNMRMKRGAMIKKV